MSLWWLLYTVDGVLFAFTALTVLYFLVFSIASLFQRRTEVKKAKHKNRYIILIPSYKQDKSILQTVNTVLGQSYPQRLFDVVVISDHQSDLTNMRLAQLPITLLTPNFDESSKAKSLQFAIHNLPQFKIYDAVVILDSGNVVEPEFLDEVNDAYVSAGTKAIQVHRISRNRDTTAARLDSIFEEVNNSIFRKGHIALGLSAGLNGSGMIFDFAWFKQNIMKVRAEIGEDKRLESMLMHESIYIDYFEDIHVYDEKTRLFGDFNQQRGRWMFTQLHSLLSNLHYLPSALIHKQYDHVDKILQWMLMPRIIMTGVIVIMSLVLPFIYFSLVIKWWIAGAVVLFAFTNATPDYLVDKNWDHDFFRAPMVIIGGFFNALKAGKDEAANRVGMASKRLIETRQLLLTKKSKNRR